MSVPPPERRKTSGWYCLIALNVASVGGILLEKLLPNSVHHVLEGVAGFCDSKVIVPVIALKMVGCLTQQGSRTKSRLQLRSAVVVTLPCALQFVLNPLDFLIRQLFPLNLLVNRSSFRSGFSTVLMVALASTPSGKI